jgi:energy-coupling factor transport system permease protein
VFLSHSLYLPGDTWLHRLHPLTKLTFSLAAVAIIFGGPGKWLPAMLRLLAPLAVVLFLVHGLFNPNNQIVLVRLGPLAVGQEGLAFAALVILRLAATLAASLLLVLSTHPAHLIQALEEAGLPSQLAYLLGSPLLLLPQMAGRVQVIQAAQQARGLETQGNLLQRGRALFPLVAPLVFSALVDVEERALALEVRGFSAPGHKTSLIELSDTRGQRAARWSMILLAGFVLAAGVWWRANGGN